jgi:sulfate adenylyltransferase
MPENPIDRVGILTVAAGTGDESGARGPHERLSDTLWGGTPPMDLLPAELDTWPVHAAGPDLLADLELLLSGVRLDLGGELCPLAGGRVALRRRPEIADQVAATGHVVLADPEGTPLAALAVDGDGGADWTGVLTPLRPPAYGSFRSLQRQPAEVRAALGAGGTLAVVCDRPLLAADLDRIRAARPGAVLLIARTAGRQAGGLPPESLVRAVLAAGRELGASVVTAPLRRLEHGDAAAAAELARAYGATEVLALDTAPWVDALARLDREEPLPAQLAPADVRAELRRWRPPAPRRGLVVFFTGLSGSGKSTLARALVDALQEDGHRTLTVLDGDVVRRELSRGLGFSQADRDLNVRRIGWVATEVARHGGLAICAPIAPYAATRAAVRAETEAVGDFFLVYVSTPLEVCEQRDRKGLYAKARAGLIPQFTGISDPYEQPTDAEFVVDTSTEPLDAARDRLLAALRAGGWLPEHEGGPGGR